VTVPTALVGGIVVRGLQRVHNSGLHTLPNHGTCLQANSTFTRPAASASKVASVIEIRLIIIILLLFCQGVYRRYGKGQQAVSCLGDDVINSPVSGKCARGMVARNSVKVPGVDEGAAMAGTWRTEIKSHRRQEQPLQFQY